MGRGKECLLCDPGSELSVVGRDKEKGNKPKKLMDEKQKTKKRTAFQRQWVPDSLLPTLYLKSPVSQHRLDQNVLPYPGHGTRRRGHSGKRIPSRSATPCTSHCFGHDTWASNCRSMLVDWTYHQSAIACRFFELFFLPSGCFILYSISFCVNTGELSRNGLKTMGENPSLPTPPLPHV